MAHIIKFVPRDELESVIQVQKFIDHARNSYMGIIGLRNIDFDQPVWTFDMRLLGQKRMKNAHIKFTKREEKVIRGVTSPAEGQLIYGPFMDFSKALFLQRLVNGSTQAISDLMAVVRAIEFVVRKRLGDDAHPSSIIKDDVIKADNILAEAGQSAYRRSAMLESLVRIMKELRLLSRPFDWENSRSKPCEMRLDISPESEKRRQEKMPSQRAIRVLIQLAMWALDGGMYKKRPIVEFDDGGMSNPKFKECSDEKDGPVVLGLALNAIGLNCRISELVLMPHDPESFTLSKGELDSDGIAEDEDRFALRWKPVKGGAQMVKPFSHQFAPFAEMIIKKLKGFSEEPRKVARHYEKSPNTLYLPPELEYLRNSIWLSEADAARIVGVEVNSLYYWTKSNDVTRRIGNIGGGIYQFKSLEAALLKLLPKGFPYVVGKRKYSESMFCCFHNQTHATRGTCRVIPSCFKQSTFEDSVSVRPMVNTHQTVFERYGFFENDGSKIGVGTHEFRHFWQTQLKKAGVSELIAAYAAGRADKNQNEAYDLRSPDEAAGLSFDIVNQSKERLFEQSALAVAHEVLESAIHTSSSGSKVVVSFSKDAIVAFDKNSGALNVQGCHITSYGICPHNYISSGCKKFMDCLDCSELLCIKGVKPFEKAAREKAEDLRSKLKEYQLQLTEDVEDGVEGADQWLDKCKRQLAKLDVLNNDVYLNDSVQDGTIIQLSSEQKHGFELAQLMIEKLGVVIECRNLLSSTGENISGDENG